MGKREHSRRQPTFFEQDTRIVEMPTPGSRSPDQETALIQTDLPAPEMSATDWEEATRLFVPTTFPRGTTSDAANTYNRIADGSSDGTPRPVAEPLRPMSFSGVITCPQPSPSFDIAPGPAHAAVTARHSLAEGSGSTPRPSDSEIARSGDAALALFQTGEHDRELDPALHLGHAATDLAVDQKAAAHPAFEAASVVEQTELRPTTMPSGPYCPVDAPELAAYQIVRQLAIGGMGIVYEAYHRASRQKVAIKYMRKASAQEPSLVKRFLGEAVAASRINHPGVTSVYDYGHDTNGVPYLVMEYLEGENLGDRLKRGPLTPAEFLLISHQVAMILGAAHLQGIVHRDLKPDNIFLVGSGAALRVKVLDFGVAKFVNDDVHLLHRTSAGQVLGTPFYMSPEQCVGDTNIDSRSDIYSLGCLLYQCLSGRVPFPGNILDVVAGHRQRDPLPLSTLTNVPPALEALIARMMAKDPAERLESMADVAQGLAAIGAGQHAAAAAPAREPSGLQSLVAVHRPVKMRSTQVRGAKSGSRRNLWLTLLVLGASTVAAGVMIALALVM